jgi:hypothetical protein
LNSRCGSETVEEDVLSQLLVSVVRCLVGRIEGVSAVTLNEKIGGVVVGLDEEVEVDVAVMLSAVVRRRVPARGMALEL